MMKFGTGLKRNRDRDADIYLRWEGGKTYAELAKTFDLSPSRIRHICLREETSPSLNPDWPWINKSRTVIK